MSSSTSVALMDQYATSTQAADERIPDSGLAHAGLTTQASGSSDLASDKAGNVAQRHAQNIADNSAASEVTLIEKPVMGLLMLRAAADAETLSKALQRRCGVSLSDRLQSETNGEYCIRWMSPDAWLLSCPLHEACAIEEALREAAAIHLAIVNVSGGYSVLELTGARARTVLMKSTSYDVHPDHFPEGKVVNTVFAKTQMTLRAVQVSDTQSHYELIVRRSFSDYVWMWIQRAALGYRFAAFKS